jgi:ATP-dependent DNA helicase RecG
MNPAIGKLKKYLQLEAQRGFDNRAIMGGLQQMLEPWRTEAEQVGTPDDLIQAVVARLRDYPRLTPQSREEVLQGLWRRVQSEFPRMGDFPEAQESPSPEEPEALAKPPAEVEAEGGKVVETAPDDDGEEGIPDRAERQAATAEKVAPAESVRAAAVESKDARREGRAASKKEKPPDGEEPRLVLDAPLTTIRGVGPKTSKNLSKLGLETLGDLLWHLPRRYDDYSKLKTIDRLWYGEDVTIIGTVESINVRSVRRGKMRLTEAVISDGTASLRVTWFNQPWIADKLQPGAGVVLSGRVEQYLGRLTLNNPEWELLEQKQLHTNRIVPVYPLTAGITSKWLRRVMNGLISRLTPRLTDPLPEAVIQSANLMPLGQSLRQVHFPDSWEELHKAQHRLAFDEMFMLQLGVLRQKTEWESLSSEPLIVDDRWMAQFKAALPFELTPAQMKALDDLRQDLAAPRPMNRLLQGDVGSGKTVIAAAGMGIAAANRHQSALLAPTSVLAEQHLATLSEILPRFSAIDRQDIRLLLGATPEAEKEEIRQGLAAGSIPVVLGTHALLEDPVNFENLGFVVIDEQHRFGVEQRAVLRAKGDDPNLMVMTATPIPRSLALTLYGDLDLSVIDELPPGRQPIDTRVLRPIERSRAYTFILSQLESGWQAFIIYPLVEESEKVDARAAVEEYERLQEEIFPEYQVGLVHGRLPPDEKEAVMKRFRSGEIDVLVSTSVIEVGIDVPNASVMLVEGADRFGLAQLHQFRGRVGRASHRSYCLLIPTHDEELENKRLKAMESTNDGFELAELDLDQRGPGDFLGTRQSGFAELRMAKLSDVRLIELARREAVRLFQSDPTLTSPEHAELAEAVDEFWEAGKGEIS